MSRCSTSAFLLATVLLTVGTSALASPGPDQAEEEILRVEGEVQAPVKTSGAPPRYTEEARKEGTEGVVILETVIDTAGHVAAVKVLEGLPNGLSEQAVEAVEAWKFEPATLHGQPVSVSYKLTIRFLLEENAEPRA